MIEKKVIPKQAEKCPECGSINLIHDYDTGERVCGDCGFVFPDPIIDQGPEWHAFNEEERAERSRVGMPESLFIHDKSLTTTLKPIYHDYSGRPIKDFSGMKRLAKWQDRSKVHSAFERNLAQALTELDRLIGKLDIPSPIKENAAVIYRKVLDKNSIRGRSIAAMVPACLYAACREAGISRTLQEIADASLVDKKAIVRCYNFLLRELNLQPLPPRSTHCVSKIAERIGISGKTQGRAVEIIQQVKKKRRTYFSGKDPRSVAAAALYFACCENNEMIKGCSGFRKPVTQREIAETARLTEVTIRNRIRDLEKILGIKIPTKSEKIRSLFMYAKSLSSP